MRKLAAYISVLFVLFMILASCTGRGRMIPDKKLVRILADILIVDEWIRINSDFNIADTSLVYDPIFEKHGFSRDDFLYTQDKYLEEPEKYGKVFEKVSKLLTDSMTVVKELDKQRIDAEIERKRRESIEVIEFESSLNYFDSLYLSGRNMLLIAPVEEKLLGKADTLSVLKDHIIETGEFKKEQIDEKEELKKVQKDLPKRSSSSQRRIESDGMTMRDFLKL